MPTNGKIAGVVLEGATPVPSCTVRLYDRPTGALLSSEVTGVHGNFLFSGLDETLTTNYFVVAFDPDGGTQYNAIVFDRLSPVTSLTRAVESIGSITDVFGSAKIEFVSYEATIKNLTPLAYWRLSEATGAPNDEQNFADMTVSAGTFTYAQSSGLFIAGNTAIRHGTVATNEYMSTGKVTGLVPGASGFSIVFLVKPDVNAYYQKWLEWRDYGAGAANKTILSFIMHNISGFEVVAQSWGSDVYTQAVGAPTVLDDRWHLCGVTYDAATNTQKMYFDGAVTATRTPATPPAWPTQASITLFNAAEGVEANSAKCTLDEVAIFNYPLSALQMSRIAGRWNSAMRFNAEDKGANIVLSNNDMTVAGTAASWNSTRLTHSKNTGRWYWEVLVEGITGNSLLAGASNAGLPTNNYTGAYAGSVGIWARAGSAPIVYVDGADTTLSVPPIAVDDVLGFVLDADIKECRIYINGVLVFARANLSRRQFPTISCLQNGRGTIRLRGGDFTYPQPVHTAAYSDVEYAPPVVAGWDATAKGAQWRVSQLSYLASYPQHGAWQSVRAITTRNSGVRYFEITMPSAMYAGGTVVGVLDAAHSLNTLVGAAAGGWGYISDARKANAGAYPAYGAAYGANDVIGVLVDFTAGSITFIKNGVSQGVAYATGVAGNLYPAISNYIGYGAVSLNMGREPFTYTLPSGAVAWDS